MTAEYESIFNEVDDWATEKKRQIELTQDPGVSTVRLNRHDCDEALPDLSKSAGEESESVED